MANISAPRDNNRVPVLLGTSSADGVTPVTVFVDPTTHRVKVDLPGGTGSVLSVAVASANGFAGTVATPTTTPVITLSTTVTGLIKGNGTAISTATAGTDYVTPTGSETLTNKDLTSGTNTFPTFNQNTTGSAATLTTTRTIWGQNFNGSANVTGTLALGSASLTMTGSIASTGSRVTKGWFTDIESTNTPTVGGVTIPTASSTTTFTNKRITPRVTALSSDSATPTINTDNCDKVNITAQTNNITSMSTNLSGTPTDMQTLWVALTAGSGTPTVTWGASFEDSTIMAPTSISTTRVDVGFVWNTATSKWRCVARA